MELNEEAFDTAVLLSSKSTVLVAWEEKRKEGDGKEPESIGKLREDVRGMSEKLETLSQKKSEIEWDLAICHKKAERLEETLPDKSSSTEQREILAVLFKLHEAEVESTFLMSSAIF